MQAPKGGWGGSGGVCADAAAGRPRNMEPDASRCPACPLRRRSRHGRSRRASEAAGCRRRRPPRAADRCLRRGAAGCDAIEKKILGRQQSTVGRGEWRRSIWQKDGRCAVSVLQLRLAGRAMGERGCGELSSPCPSAGHACGRGRMGNIYPELGGRVWLRTNGTTLPCASQQRRPHRAAGTRGKGGRGMRIPHRPLQRARSCVPTPHRARRSGGAGRDGDAAPHPAPPPLPPHPRPLPPYMDRTGPPPRCRHALPSARGGQRGPGLGERGGYGVGARPLPATTGGPCRGRGGRGGGRRLGTGAPPARRVAPPAAHATGLRDTQPGTGAGGGGTGARRAGGAMRYFARGGQPPRLVCTGQ